MAAYNPPAAQAPFKPGDIVKENYTLIQQIGAGSYGAIFEAIYKKGIVAKPVAIKFEKITFDKPVLCNEIIILKALDGNKHYAHFYQYGTHERYKFIAMELLGPCLIDLINRKIPYRFCLHSILKFGIQAIESLQALHKAGYIHRDIKPSNFVIGNTVDLSSRIYLIDFGLCKKLFMKDGIIIKPSMKSGFRGTIRYASANSHRKRELGRQDDLMSLIYIFVEFYTGTLPWVNIVDPDEVMRLKELYQGGSLFANMPSEFMEFEDHILSLDYATEPDYLLLTSLLHQIAKNNQIDISAPFDWEIEMKLMRDIKMQEKQEEMNKIQNQTNDSNLNLNSNQKQTKSDQQDQNFNSMKLVQMIKQKNKELFAQYHHHLIKYQQQQQQQQQQQNQQQQQQNQQQQQQNQQQQQQQQQQQNQHYHHYYPIYNKTPHVQMVNPQLYKSISMNQINSQQNSYKTFQNLNEQNNSNININNKIELIINNKNNNIQIIPPRSNSQQNTNIKIADEKPVNQIEHQKEEINHLQIQQIVVLPHSDKQTNNNENDQNIPISSPFQTNQHRSPDSSNDIKQGLAPISPISLSITPSKSNQSNLLQTPIEQLSIKQIQFPTIKTDSNDSSNFDDSNSKSSNRNNQFDISQLDSLIQQQSLNQQQQQQQQLQQQQQQQNQQQNQQQQNIGCLSTVNSHSSQSLNQFLPSQSQASVNQIAVKLQQEQLIVQFPYEDKQLKKKKAKFLHKQKKSENEVQTKENNDLGNIEIKQQQLIEEQMHQEPQVQLLKDKSEDLSKLAQLGDTNHIANQKKLLSRRATIDLLPTFLKDNKIFTPDNIRNKSFQYFKQEPQEESKDNSLNLLFNGGHQLLQIIPADPQNQSQGDMRDNTSLSNDSQISDISDTSVKDEHHICVDKLSIMSQVTNITNNPSAGSFLHFLSPVANLAQRSRRTSSLNQSYRSQSDEKDIDELSQHSSSLAEDNIIINNNNKKVGLRRSGSNLSLNEKELIGNLNQPININNKTSYSLSSLVSSPPLITSYESESKYSQQNNLQPSNQTPQSQQLRRNQSASNECIKQSSADRQSFIHSPSYEGLSEIFPSIFSQQQQQQQQQNNDKVDDNKQDINVNHRNTGFGYGVRAMSQSKLIQVEKIKDNVNINANLNAKSSIANNNNKEQINNNQIANTNQIGSESINNNLNTENSINWDQWVKNIDGIIVQEENITEYPKKLETKKVVKGKQIPNKDKQQSNINLYDNSLNSNLDISPENKKISKQQSNNQQNEDQQYKNKQVISPIQSPENKLISINTLKSKDESLIYDVIRTPLQETKNIVIVPQSQTQNQQILLKDQYNQGQLNIKLNEKEKINNEKEDNQNIYINNKEQIPQKDEILQQGTQSDNKNNYKQLRFEVPSISKSPGISLTIRDIYSELFEHLDDKTEIISADLYTYQINQENIISKQIVELLEEEKVLQEILSQSQYSTTQQQESQSSSLSPPIHLTDQSTDSASHINNYQTKQIFPAHNQSLSPNQQKHKTSAQYQTNKGVNITQDQQMDNDITSLDNDLSSQKIRQKSPLSQIDAWKPDDEEQDASSHQQQILIENNNNQLQQLGEQRVIITQQQEIKENLNDSTQLLLIDNQKQPDIQLQESENNQQQINANMSSDDLNNTSSCCIIL